MNIRAFAFVDIGPLLYASKARYLSRFPRPVPGKNMIKTEITRQLLLTAVSPSAFLQLVNVFSTAVWLSFLMSLMAMSVCFAFTYHLYMLKLPGHALHGNVVAKLDFFLLTFIGFSEPIILTWFTRKSMAGKWMFPKNVIEHNTIASCNEYTFASPLKVSCLKSLGLSCPSLRPSSS